MVSRRWPLSVIVDHLVYYNYIPSSRLGVTKPTRSFNQHARLDNCTFLILLSLTRPPFTLPRLCSRRPKLSTFVATFRQPCSVMSEADYVWKKIMALISETSVTLNKKLCSVECVLKYVCVWVLSFLLFYYFQRSMMMIMMMIPVSSEPLGFREVGAWTDLQQSISRQPLRSLQQPS